jgi:hypothetical protein
MEFGEKARKAQGIFRDTSITISSVGRNPIDSKGIRYNHLLALGSEIENLFPGIRDNGQVLRFFKERGIKWWKSLRSGDD